MKTIEQTPHPGSYQEDNSSPTKNHTRMTTPLVWLINDIELVGNTEVEEFGY